MPSLSVSRVQGRSAYDGVLRMVLAQGAPLSVPQVSLPELFIGRMRLRQVEALVMTFPSALKLDGIIGMNVLRQFRVTLESDTSTPELVVSMQSAFRGQTDIALGNVVGRNIFNVLFILGTSALIIPLVVSQQLIRFDVPLMIGLSFLVLFLGLDGYIARWDGLVLVTGFVVYTVWIARQSRKEQASVQQEYANEFGPPPQTFSWKRGLLHLGSIAIMVYYARWWTQDADQVGATAILIASSKVNLSFALALVRGILANALVCLAVWLAAGGRTVIDKVVAVLFPIAAFVASGFEHSIANIYFIPLGLLLADHAEVMQATSLTAAQISRLTLGGFLHNLAAATLGNIIGGAMLVGLVYWFIYLRDDREKT